MRAESRDSYGNREFEIVAGGCEALRRPKAVAEAAPVRGVQCHEENNHKVDGQRNGDSHDRYDLVDHLVTLVCEEDEDRVQQTDQRPRRDEPQEHALKPVGSRHGS